jgi:heme/copper-type cytochrome/quinol oxidase subunit 2
MKNLAFLLIVFSALIGAFGYWGTYTKAGRQTYDEMAGMIPFFALLLSAIFLSVAVLLFVFSWFKNK